MDGSMYPLNPQQLIVNTVTTKRNKTVCIFHGIYCACSRPIWMWVIWWLITMTQTPFIIFLVEKKVRFVRMFKMKRHHRRASCTFLCYLLYSQVEGILPKGPYPPCLRMADRALLAGYPRSTNQSLWSLDCSHDFTLFPSTANSSTTVPSHDDCQDSLHNTKHDLTGTKIFCQLK